MKQFMAHCLKNNLYIQFFCEESLVSYYRKAGLEKFAIGMRVKEKIAVQNEQILK